MSSTASASVAYIGLGANLGDARATLTQAMQELAAHAAVSALALSPFYRSAPVDAGGPDYINAVARVTTTLAPLDLLDQLQALELRHGRERPYVNAPRTLDLDLLFYDALTLAHPRLVLPHPRLHQRAFVLLPLADLGQPLPVSAEQLSTWLTACADQRIERLDLTDASTS